MLQTITTTELRTKSKDLVETLLEGGFVDLIHRSKNVGQLIPVANKKYKIINASKLEDKVQKLDLPKLTQKEMDRRYRAAMMKKHGKGISGH